MNLEALLACPGCHSPVRKEAGAYRCDPCARAYPIREGVPVFLTEDATSKDMNQFWDSGWRKRREEEQHERIHGRPDERAGFQAMEREYRQTGNPMLKALPRTGEVVLNIGCGLGEAPMFTHLGALDYIGVDFSFTAAFHSLETIRRLGSRGFTVQANAELLPIASEAIDIVYSNGVLHHTPSTEKTLEEVLRVMKPGGRGIIGLYATYSPMFLLARLVGWVKSLREGKGKGWYEYTECDWDTAGKQNPWTKTYSAPEIRAIFRRLPVTGLRLTYQGFLWGNVLPRLGKHLDANRVGRSLATRLQSRLGGMVIITFTKSPTPRA